MTKRNLFVTLILIVLIAGGVFMVQRNQTPQHPLTIINAGFESNPLEGWKTAGVVEAEGYESEKRLTHPGGNAPVESIQKVSDISNGWYTSKVWVKSTGKQKEAYIALKDCGEDAQASVPIVREKWLQVVVSAKVTKHQCTLSLYSDADEGEWVSFDNVDVVPGRAALTAMGADISSLKKSEDKGGVYAYEDGTQADALKILHDHGMNYARIRVWVDSPDGYAIMAKSSCLK